MQIFLKLFTFDYKCENEVRAVKFGMLRNQQDKKYDGFDKICEIPNDFEFKKVLNPTKIVYYKEFNFEKIALGGIIVKANEDAEFNDIREHLEMWLCKCGGYYVSSNFIQQSKRVPVRKF